MIEEPVQYVEIDIDTCTLTWGTGACTAALSLGTPNKCRNTWGTCGISSATRADVYDKGVLTLRFIKSRPKMPIDGRLFFPVLTNISSFSATANIVGFKTGLGTLGRRGTVTVNLDDFPYNDNYTDKYSQERISGDAQFDSVGYNPFQKSTFWTKLRNWSPNYAGRPLRVIDTFIYLLSDGTPVWSGVKATRNFIVTDIKQDYTNKKVTVEGKDVLTLAEKESAVAPKPSKGKLLADITTDATEATLTPEGIGDLEYPTEGYLIIGKEVMSYTRSGDVLTLTERGAEKTEATTHNSGDLVQQAKRFQNASINEVVEYLLGETDVDPAFIPTADYATEVGRWAPTLRINTILTRPEAVTKYLGELSTLGVSLWWDDIDQEVVLRMNHPLDFTETVIPVSDDSSIKSISVVDKDEERITQVHFYCVQSNPTDSLDNKNNYDRIELIFDADAQYVDNYNGTRIKEIFCRWFNTGNDAAVGVIGSRYLQRFNTSPKYHTIVVDKKDGLGKIGDVLEVTSQYTVDVNGTPEATNLQIIGKTELMQGHEIQYSVQSYDFDIFSSFIMENDANGYDTATEAELNIGCYIVDETTLIFPDGRQPYSIM